MKLVLLGSVDAGKTTFYRRYFRGVIHQKLNRTQKISVLPFKLKDQTVYLLDTPGHKALFRFKQISATMADLVLYIVDCQTLDLSVLENLGKNCLVLLNKIDVCDFYKGLQNKSLKEILKDSKLRNYLHRQLSRLIGKQDSIAPFLDNDPEKTVAFPVSLKTGFGLQQLQSFICNFYIPRFKTQRSYLYLENSSSKKKQYRLVGPFKDPSVIRVKGVEYLLRNLFDYKPYSGFYVLKAEYFKYLENMELIEVFDKGQEGDSELKVLSIKEQQLYFPELKQLVQKLDTSEYEFLIRSESAMRVETIQNILNSLNLKSKLVEISSTKFKQLRKKNQLYLEWTCNPKGSQEGYYSRDSLYELIDDLKEFFVKQKERIHQQMKTAVLSNCLGELLQQSVFKQEKKEVVIGYNPLFGTLKVGPVFLFSSEGLQTEAVVQSIKEKNNPFMSWSKKQKCAVKIRCGNTFEVLKRKQIYVKNLDLEVFLKKELPVDQFCQLKDCYNSILPHHSS